MAPSRMHLAATATLTILVMALSVHHGTQQAQAKEQAAHIHRRRAGRQRHVKNIVFYMHDIPTAPNATAVIVAAQNGKLTPTYKMGMTVIFDDKLTEGPDPKSREIGRGQGLYSFASLTNFDLLLIFTAVLHKPAVYNGSTICLHGSDRIFLPEREIGVVGGTGHFRFAQGYAILSTAASNSNGNAVIKFNVTMLL